VTASSPELELTVLLPCLNEAETLRTCVVKAREEMLRLGVHGEVVVADNGSTDGSQDIAREEGARVVDVPEKGYGAALLGGISAARGTYVIMADADDSYGLDDLAPFLEHLRNGSDLVMGNRFKGERVKGAMPPLHRYIGNPVLSSLGRLFFRLPVRDFHCGIRGFSRDRIQSIDLRTTGMEFASEMVVKAKLQGLTITEVPTTLRPDGRSRAPHLRTWRDGWRHLRFLLVFSPNWLFLYPGAALALIGSAGVAWLSQGRQSLGPYKLDLQSMLFFAVALVTGVQAMLLSQAGHLMGAELGFLPDDARSRRLRHWPIERGLLAGALAGLVGLAGLARSVVQWSQADFGQLDVFSSMRGAILSFAILVVGLQVLLTSFLLGLVQVQRRPG
jgi:hypothetical protein